MRNKFSRRFRRRDACGPGDEDDAVSGRERGFRNRVAHFSRGTIAEEANGIDRFARRAGGDDEPHAIKLSWRASRNSARKAMSSTFHKRPTPSYPQASIPSSGPMNSTPRAFSFSTFSWVAGCSHIFPFMVSATKIGARVAEKRWVAASGCRQSVCEFRDRRCRRKRDEKKDSRDQRARCAPVAVFLFVEGNSFVTGFFEAFARGWCDEFHRVARHHDENVVTLVSRASSRARRICKPRSSRSRRGRRISDFLSVSRRSQETPRVEMSGRATKEFSGSFDFAALLLRMTSISLRPNAGSDTSPRP